MKVKWGTSDLGNVHTTTIDDDEIAGCSSVDEAMVLIKYLVDSDFADMVYPVITSKIDEDEIRRLIKGKQQ